MARKPMVTRSITTTEVNVLCLDTDKCEPFNQVLKLPRTFKDEKKLMEKVRETVDKGSVKAVHIVDRKEVETMYGMDEETFIATASVLDPETRKPLVISDDKSND